MIQIINPSNSLPLRLEADRLVDDQGNAFPIINGVARISGMDNYAQNFGFQWNRFDQTQLDREIDGLTLSCNRFFALVFFNIRLALNLQSKR